MSSACVCVHSGVVFESICAQAHGYISLFVFRVCISLSVSVSLSLCFSYSMLFLKKGRVYEHIISMLFFIYMCCIGALATSRLLSLSSGGCLSGLLLRRGGSLLCILQDVSVSLFPLLFFEAASLCICLYVCGMLFVFNSHVVITRERDLHVFRVCLCAL